MNDLQRLVMQEEAARNSLEDARGYIMVLRLALAGVLGAIEESQNAPSGYDSALQLGALVEKMESDLREVLDIALGDASRQGAAVAMLDHTERIALSEARARVVRLEEALREIDSKSTEYDATAWQLGSLARSVLLHPEEAIHHEQPEQDIASDEIASMRIPPFKGREETQ